MTTVYFDEISFGSVNGVIAIFSYIGAVNLPITHQFIDESVCSGCTIDSWSWDFGDGATSDLQNPIHEFTEAGTYNVTLTVTAGEYTDSCTHELILYEPSQSQGAIDGNWRFSNEVVIDNITVDLIVKFTAGSGNIYAGMSVTNYPATSYCATFRLNNSSNTRNMKVYNQTCNHSISGSETLYTNRWYTLRMVIYPQWANCIDYYEDGVLINPSESSDCIPYGEFMGLNVYAQLCAVSTQSAIVIGGTPDLEYSSLTQSASSIYVGESVSYSLTPKYHTKTTIDYDDGTPYESINRTGTISDSHTYNIPGTYHPTITLYNEFNDKTEVITLDTVIVNPTTFIIQQPVVLRQPIDSDIEDTGMMSYGKLSIIHNKISNTLVDIGRKLLIATRTNNTTDIVKGGVIHLYNVIHLRIVGRV